MIPEMLLPHGAETFQVLLTQTGERYVCRIREAVLHGMTRLGRKGIPVGCVGGGCGVCRIRITAGVYRRLSPMSREFISDEDERQGVVLACCVTPRSDIEVEVLGKMGRALQSGSSIQQQPAQLFDYLSEKRHGCNED